MVSQIYKPYVAYKRRELSFSCMIMTILTKFQPQTEQVEVTDERLRASHSEQERIFGIIRTILSSGGESGL
jgi:hypothetical protein